MSNAPLERVKTWIAAHAAASAARDAEIAEHGFEVNDERWLDVLALMPPVQEIAEGLVASAAEVENLRAELEEARLTLAAEQGRAEGAPSEGWRAAGGDWSKGRARVKRSGFLWRWHVYAPQPNDHKATIASGLAPAARAAMLAADTAHTSTPPTTP